MRRSEFERLPLAAVSIRCWKTCFGIAVGTNGSDGERPVRVVAAAATSTLWPPSSGQRDLSSDGPAAQRRPGGDLYGQALAFRL